MSQKMSFRLYFDSFHSRNLWKYELPQIFFPGNDLPVGMRQRVDLYQELKARVRPRVEAEAHVESMVP